MGASRVARSLPAIVVVCVACSLVAAAEPPQRHLAGIVVNGREAGSADVLEIEGRYAIAVETLAALTEASASAAETSIRIDTPLGSVEVLFEAEMKNLIGDDALDWLKIMNEPGAHLHLYGKRDIRPGRKMGHVNRLFPHGTLKT